VSGVRPDEARADPSCYGRQADLRPDLAHGDRTGPIGVACNVGRTSDFAELRLFDSRMFMREPA